MLGIIGTNGIGKSTALSILAGKIKPNLGNFEVCNIIPSLNFNCYQLLLIFIKNPPDWIDIVKHFRGSQLQNYFKRILEDNLRAVIKLQYVHQIPKVAKVKASYIEIADK